MTLKKEVDLQLFFNRKQSYFNNDRWNICIKLIITKAETIYKKNGKKLSNTSNNVELKLYISVINILLIDFNFHPQIINEIQYVKFSNLL